MYITIQKSLEEILGYLAEGEKIFIVGCGNCAARCKSGGEEQAEEMKSRLEYNSVTVTGWAVPSNGGSTCELSTTRELLIVHHKEEVEKADSFLILACGQGIHTVLDVVGDKLVHPGCDTIFGGEIVSDDFIMEYCSLCGECIVEYTGGLCPLTLCTKGLLNGPCSGALNGKCEVDIERDCGWRLIYERLKAIGRLESLRKYHEPKDYSKWTKPRSLSLKSGKPEFKFLSGVFSP